MMAPESWHSFFLKNSNQKAIIQLGQTITYEEWLKIIKIKAAYFLQVGINRKSKIAIKITDDFETLTALYALWFLDCTAIPLFTQLPKKRIEEIYKDIRFSFLISDTPENFSFNILDPQSQGEEGYREDSLTQDNKEDDKENDEALIIFTSGTSGRPKGVSLSHSNIYYSALGTNHFYGLIKEDSWMLTLPLHHVGGILISLRSLIAGASTVIPKSKKEWPALIKKCSPSFYSLVDAQIEQILEENHQKTKAVIIGGGKCSAENLQHLRKKNIPFSLTYGMTETAAQITATDPQSRLIPEKSTGQVLPFRKIQVGPKNSILISGKTLSKGYYDHDHFCPIDDIFKTADKGFINEDGHLFLQERSDLIFISGGENISPIEIEDILNSLSYISASVVVPVFHHHFGDVPYAFLLSDKAIDFKKVKMFLEEKLPNYKIPKFFYQIDVIPQLGIKYDRNKLKRFALQNQRDQNV